MNNEIRYILEKIKEKFENNEYLDALIVYGSIARNEEDIFSDIDLIFYTNNYSIAEKEILETLKELFNLLNYQTIKLFKRKDKFVIYLYNKNFDYIFKLEYLISDKSKIKDDVILLVQSRINNLKNAVLIDKIGIKKLLWKYLSNIEPPNIKEIINDNINGFIYYYTEFLTNFSRGDIFRAYFDYNLTFFKIASLLSILYGEFRNLYKPMKLTQEIIRDKELLEEFYNSSTSMKPIEIFYKREQLKNLFLKILQALEEKYNLPLKDYKTVIDLLDNKHNPFFNFRDIGKTINFLARKKILKENKIFRSGTLDKYRIKEINKVIDKNDNRLKNKK